MQGLKRPQKEKVRAFQSFTGASEAEAIDCLKACDWRLDAAADRFFLGGGGGSSANVDAAAIASLFDKYKEPTEDSIQVSGIERLCADLKVVQQTPSCSSSHGR